MTPAQWHRRKRQEAEEHTLEQYPPEQRLKVATEGWGVLDVLKGVVR